MATLTAEDSDMHLTRVPRVFRNTYWYRGIHARVPLHNEDIPIIDNRADLYTSMHKIGKVAHLVQLPNYVQKATFPEWKQGGGSEWGSTPGHQWMMDSLKKYQEPGYDHTEFYRIKGERTMWITITSPYGSQHTEKLAKDGFFKVKPLYTSSATSYIRVQILNFLGQDKVSLMTEEDYQALI
jgi:hypothetical protein